MIKRKKKPCGQCGNEDYIFGKGLCRKCYNRQLKPLPKASKPIKKVSKKLSERTRKYMQLRDDYLQRHPICECCNLAKSTEIHHKAGRVAGNLFKHFLAVCHDCHVRIEMNPLWAKENNFSISRLSDNETDCD